MVQRTSTHIASAKLCTQFITRPNRIRNKVKMPLLSSSQQKIAMFVIGIVLACMIIITFCLACYLTSRLDENPSGLRSKSADTPLRRVTGTPLTSGLKAPLVSGLGAPTATAVIPGPLHQQQKAQQQQAQQAQAQQAQAQARAQAQAQQQQAQAQQQQAQQPGAPEVTGEQALALIGRQTTTIVIVTSASCGHCTRLKATLSQLRAAGSLAGFNIVILPSSELPKLAGRITVSGGVPALFKTFGGQVLDKAVGNMPADVLLNFFSKPLPSA